MAARFSGPGQPYEGLAYFGPNRKAHWTGKVKPAEGKLAEPLKWRKPARVFVNSMSDLFHEDVPDEFIDKVFAIMAACPRHTFQVLTKRAERMANYLNESLRESGRWDRMLYDGRFEWPSPLSDPGNADGDTAYRRLTEEVPLPNVWLGVSVEDQKRADERIPHLIDCPAAVRFLSMEPLLTPVNLDRWLTKSHMVGRITEAHGGTWLRVPNTESGISWIVIGGESGAGARPFDLSWARSIRDQCRVARVPYFFKQAGSHPIGPYDERMAMIGGSPIGTDAVVRWKLADSHGGDLAELPTDLRIRQTPRIMHTPKEVANG